jgi:hypothetical protein
MRVLYKYRDDDDDEGRKALFPSDHYCRPSVLCIYGRDGGLSISFFESFGRWARAPIATASKEKITLSHATLEWGHTVMRLHTVYYVYSAVYTRV